LKVKIALSDKQLRKTSAQLEKGMEELEKTQEALIRAERMAAMGTLAGGVAHEFNNINTAILGFSEIVLLQTDLDEETLDCLERIRKAALRSASITRNLLTFSGSKKGDPVSTDIKEVITETIDLVDRDLEKDKVTLETDLKPVPMSVMDGSQIGQVILNLLINAKHALTGRKHKKLRVSSTVQDGCILVSVSDNGCGISKENIREIFTPFYSTKGEHAPKGSPHAEIKGTGLGLCVSETIMRKHNGDIIVESEIDKGTTFTLKLPIVRGRESERTRPRERKQSVAGKIVAVEDEPDTRDLLSLLLNRCGHDAFLTESGHQALEYIKENGDIDLLLADLRMSEMSGMELLEEIAKLPVDIRPKVIVVSGQLGPEEMRGLEEFEVFDKVLKPFEIDHLMERVDEAIRQKRLFQQ
jgi:nitrogen-specific signal transduction histidine kinase/CheY-like chemotaxis protein